MRKKYIINKNYSYTPSVTLHKVNGDIIGEFIEGCLVSTTDNIDDIDTVELSVPKLYMSSNGSQYIKYGLFNEIREEN